MGNIDASTLEGKKRIMEILMQGDRVPYPYKVKKSARDAYLTAIKYFMPLVEEGKCKLNIDDVDDPLELHCIYVEWNMDLDLPIQVVAKDVGKIISSMQDMVLDTFRDNATWCLSIQIYVPF